jgi:hypothetical protein
LTAVPRYFVFFVTDPVDDGLAAEVQRRIRMVAAARAWSEHPPGFFDEPEPQPGSPRTTGGFLRVDGEAADGDDLRALCASVQAMSRDLEVDVELQWCEAVLGRVRAGVPDEGLEEGLSAAAGED